MTIPPEQVSPQKRKIMLYIIWAGMMISCGIFWFIGSVVLVPVTPEESSLHRDLPALRSVFLALAVGGVVGAGYLKKFLQAHGTPETILVGNITAFALCEAAALYGLVLRCMGAGGGTLSIFLGIALASLLYYFPRPES